MTKTIETRRTHATGATRFVARTIGTAVCVVAVGGAVLTGCSTESPEAGSSASVSAGHTPKEQATQGQVAEGEAPADAAPDSADSAPREGLPEGFPADIPLPDFTDAHKVGGSADSGFWVVLLQLTNSTDSPVEDYAAQLTDAGYTVTDGSGGKEATNDTWDVSFHSAMDQTVTISVIES